MSSGEWYASRPTLCEDMGCAYDKHDLDRVDQDLMRLAYAFFEVPSTISMDELKRTFRKKCAQTHPDKGGDVLIYKKA